MCGTTTCDAGNYCDAGNSDCQTTRPGRKDEVIGLLEAAKAGNTTVAEVTVKGIAADDISDSEPGAMVQLSSAGISMVQQALPNCNSVPAPVTFPGVYKLTSNWIANSNNYDCTGTLTSPGAQMPNSWSTTVATGAIAGDGGLKTILGLNPAVTIVSASVITAATGLKELVIFVVAPLSVPVTGPGSVVSSGGIDFPPGCSSGGVPCSPLTIAAAPPTTRQLGCLVQKITSGLSMADASAACASTPNSLSASSSNDEANGFMKGFVLALPLYFPFFARFFEIATGKNLMMQGIN